MLSRARNSRNIFVGVRRRDVDLSIAAELMNTIPLATENGALDRLTRRQRRALLGADMAGSPLKTAALLALDEVHLYSVGALHAPYILWQHEPFRRTMRWSTRSGFKKKFRPLMETGSVSEGLKNLSCRPSPSRTHFEVTLFDLGARPRSIT